MPKGPERAHPVPLQGRREYNLDLAQARFKHSCLFCLVYRLQLVPDTEWHALCECPSVDAARNRFRETTNVEIHVSSPCTVQNLCQFVSTVAKDSHLAGALAHFSYIVRATRRHLFRKLSSDGPSGRIFVVTQLQHV